ncbi:hypothetical protein AOLI_G00323040 [Acnodon oligacanthus]
MRDGSAAPSPTLKPHCSSSSSSSTDTPQPFRRTPRSFPAEATSCAKPAAKRSNGRLYLLCPRSCGAAALLISEPAGEPGDASFNRTGEPQGESASEVPSVRTPPAGAQRRLSVSHQPPRTWQLASLSFKRYFPSIPVPCPSQVRRRITRVSLSASAGEQRASIRPSVRPSVHPSPRSQTPPSCTSSSSGYDPRGTARRSESRHGMSGRCRATPSSGRFIGIGLRWLASPRSLPATMPPWVPLCRPQAGYVGRSGVSTHAIKVKLLES